MVAAAKFLLPTTCRLHAARSWVSNTSNSSKLKVTGPVVAAAREFVITKKQDCAARLTILSVGLIGGPYIIARQPMPGSAAKLRFFIGYRACAVFIRVMMLTRIG